ncbi:hypothetical protein V8G54_008893 [Vigna mungo]|uniref:Uncharacterized protein n=1 Tax=Vigna mungo TaxID=3915 RepID=A0AAQ3SAA2_VIGMU
MKCKDVVERNQGSDCPTSCASDGVKNIDGRASLGTGWLGGWLTCEWRRERSLPRGEHESKRIDMFKKRESWTDQQRAAAAKEGWGYRLVFSARLIGVFLAADVLYIGAQQIGRYLQDIRTH